MREINQVYTLYNVAGLIDKAKNIYFVPHKADIYAKRISVRRSRVNSCYEALFSEVCPPSTTYSDIQISNWSPEDRALRVNGTIDDFRASRGQGLALNYCIVTRSVRDEEEGDVTLSTYYYAFFIDSVRQSGTNCVELILSVDYFTNFFYLNNEELITRDYDPFNPVMRNCFVERQHYDRLEIDPEDSHNLLPKNESIILGTNEYFRYRYQYKDSKFLLPLGFDLTYTRFKLLYNRLKSVVTKTEFITFLNGLGIGERKCFMSLFISYLNIDFKENYLCPINYGIVSSDSTRLVDKYYGYKGGLTKSGKDISSPIVHYVLPFISIPYDLSNIHKDWITQSLHINVYNSTLGIVNWSPEPSEILNYLERIGANQYILTAYISKYSPISKNIQINIGTNYATIDFVARLNQTNAKEIIPTTAGNLNPDKTYESLSIIDSGQPALALLPIFKTVHDTAEWTKDVIVTNNIYIGKEGSSPNVSPNVDAMIIGDENYQNFDFNDTIDLFTHTGGQTTFDHFEKVKSTNLIELSDKLGFILPSTEMNTFELDFSDFIDYDLFVGYGFYYEPILESDPYRFYSISYNEIEQIIHKLRYIGDYKIMLTPIISYNDSYKVGLVPTFKVNNKAERYYGESLVTVTSSQIPIIEDSWLSYYTQNKAQMKNQYAVNDFQKGTDLAQRFFNTAPANIGSAFVGGGTAKGYSQIIKEVSGMVDDTIDWAQSNVVIKLQQSSKLADMGSRPDTVKLSGSDMLYDLSQNDLGFHINAYNIDWVSYQSIAKYLERNGYEVSIQDELNPFNRIGLNYIKLGSFDFVEDNIKISQEQADAITSIFREGVTLLHNKDYLHNLGEDNYHNIETSLYVEGGDN